MTRRTFALASALLLTSTVAALAVASPAHATPAPALSCDYNGDGYGDVVVGEPNRPLLGFPEAGVVKVVYGTPFGLNSVGSAVFNEASTAVAGTLGSDRFGHAVATGNFDGDEYADVAIGAPRHNSTQGEVVVLYGSSSGLHGTAAAQAKSELLTVAQYVPAQSLGLLDFGGALATGDFNADGYADLAVSAQGTQDGGGVAVIYGGPTGLAESSLALWLDQETPGVPGVGDPGDLFGGDLAAGDFNGDGRDDLAVGASGKNVNAIEAAGEIFVLFADATGVLTGTGAVSFNQDTPGVPDTAEQHDWWGTTVAAGDMTGDGIDELAATAIHENGFAGMVIVLKGSPTGPTAAGAQSFSGITAGENFGASIEIFNADGNQFKELAIGVPRRAVADLADAGVVKVWYGTSAGATGVSTIWSQNTTGVIDQAEVGDLFGYSLRGVGNSTGGAQALIVGVMSETYAGVTACGALTVLKGGPSGLTGSGSQLVPDTGLAGGAYSGSGFAFALG